MNIFHEKVYISQFVLYATWFIHVLKVIDFSQFSRDWTFIKFIASFKQVIINRTNQDLITEEVFVNKTLVVETSTIVETEKIDIEIEVELKLNLAPYKNASSDTKSTTDSLNGRECFETTHRVYDEIVQ